MEETPVLAGDRPSIVLVGDDAPAMEDATDAIRRKAKSLRNQIGPHLPAVRRDTQTLNPDHKTRIRRALRNQPRDATEPAEFSISTDTRTATFAGASFPLDYDPALAVSDAQLMVEYFAGFEGFAGTPEEVCELQEEYFAFWAWLYFSPFMCDLRTSTSSTKMTSPRTGCCSHLQSSANCSKTAQPEASRGGLHPSHAPATLSGATRASGPSSTTCSGLPHGSMRTAPNPRDGGSTPTPGGWSCANG